MAKLKIVAGNDRSEVDIPEDMLTASDAQILSYISETLHRSLPEKVTVERSSTAITVHPEAVYG